MNIAKIYRKFLENQDKELERILIYELYKKTYSWFINGFPEEQFLNELLELFLDYEEPIEVKSLLDLGILKLIEVVHLYNTFENIENSNSELQKSLKQCLMPFLAYIDEISYREMKNIEFLEIDFSIYEIISGELPHHSIQDFLRSTKETDVWTIIKYFEDISNQQIIIELIESLIKNYQTQFEKYILITYLIYRFQKKFEENINFNDKINIINLPNDISYKELKFIYSLTRNFLTHHKLEMDFFTKFQNSKLETIGLICLLTLFEICNPELTNSWIEVFERSINNLWICNYKQKNVSKKYQPIPEFAINIFAFFQENEQRRILKISKILILFFQNINKYSYKTFEELSDLLSIHSDLFEEELKFQLKYFHPKNLKRFSKCAFKINKKIVRKGNLLELVDLKYEW